MRKSILIISCVAICYACTKNSKKERRIISEQIQSFPQTERPQVGISYIKYINDNDVRGYNNLSADEILADNQEDLLYYSLMMANKNKTPSAYYYLFDALYYPTHDMLQLDEGTKNLALYYLLKSHELGYEDSKYELDKIFGKNKKLEKSGYYLLEYSK